MHPSRRRKKRPSYGIRTVEVARGPSGFGFTISGQQPCILSCIVAHSPADQAGLRAGDFLISVNGVSVSKITHDAVVNLIGNSVGCIKMTIAENYYSDSSDEDISLGRGANARKPKYPHKPRGMHRGYIHKKVGKHKEAPLYNDVYEEGACSLNPMEEEGGPIEYKAIVGYLGTIEMPKQLPPDSRLQTVCACIKKLRQEKRKPTAVLMTVLPTCLTLKNSSNHILAIYPTNRVVYISSSMDKDSRYFGLVTSAVCDRSLENVQRKCETSYTNVWNNEKKCNNVDRAEVDVSNSCHVFVTDPKIIEHNQHVKRAESFRITCTNDVVTGYCLEFPRNALYIVSLVQNMYRLQCTVEPHRAIEDLVANSPQPSASSNSDSGIGFRDDCGNVSDRILVVEFPASRPLPIIPNNTNRPINIIASNLNLDGLYNNNNNENLNNVRACRSAANLNNIRACENLSIKNAIERGGDYLAKQNNDLTEADADRLNCRAYHYSQQQTRSADVDTGVIYTERAVDVEEDFDNVSMHSSHSLEGIFKVPYVDTKKRHKRAHNLVGSCSSLVADQYENSLLSYKLSPKVYGVAKPNYSCEELNRLEGGGALEKCGGSLQDLSVWCGGSGERNRAIAQSEPDVRVTAIGSLCDNNGTVKTSSGGPAEWAASFEKLLDCTTGLHTFAEFLKKEFSAENIYFWAACERYRKLNPGAERTEEAHRIYQQHLRVGAPEAVNVDSHARQNAEQTLQNVTAALFIPAQKQIFNLMKFDSYSRFLKSDLYKQCLLGTPDKVQLDPNLLLHPTTPSKLKKSLSNAEDRRRKSLLPWHRKNRSKSKERDVVELAEGNNNNKRCDVNENVAKLYVKSDVHSSRSSLTSLDLAISANTDGSKLCHDQILNPCRPPLCRVNLVNGSTTVVQIKNMETIQQLVQRLLDKRGIVYTSFEVSTDKHSKTLNLSEPSSKLAGCEVDVQQKVTFKLDLPNKKVIAVKSKSTKVLEDVLRPILSRYSYTLEEVCVTHNSQLVDVNQSVISVDTLRLNIQLNNPQNILENIATQIISKPKMPSLLDELTNQVYEDILQEKSDTTAVKSRSERGSVKSEDWGSENSSSFMGRFIKRDSERNRDRKKKLSTRSKGNSVSSSIEDITCEPSQQQNGMICKKPLIAKWKAGVKVQNTSESEELYEGLSRAQRSRLEDQRGTEINFELPDFLKDKENDHANKRGFLSAAATIPEATPKMARGGGDVHCNYENRALISEFGNNSNRMYVTSTYQPAELKAPIDNKVVDVGQGSPRAEPPPLPPKPKILPMKPSNWKLRESTRKGGLYLEQPTSSFV